MTLAGLILVFGRIADRGALKKVFVYGFTIFTVASFMCGASNSLPMLLVSRTLQGVGGAMIAASGPMLCVKYISMKKMGFALSMITLGSSVGYAIGPVLGGILTEFLSWHWIFLINIPIGLLAIPFAIHVIPKDGPIEKRPLDLLGSMFMFGAIATGILALERLSNPDALNVVVVSAVLCVVFLTLFVLRELSFDKPVIDVRIFKSVKFSSVLLSFILFNLVMGPFYRYSVLHVAVSRILFRNDGAVSFHTVFDNRPDSSPCRKAFGQNRKKMISILAFPCSDRQYCLFINVENVSDSDSDGRIDGTSPVSGGPHGYPVVEHALTGARDRIVHLFWLFTSVWYRNSHLAAYFPLFTGARERFASDYGRIRGRFLRRNASGHFVAAIALILAAVIRDTDKVGSKTQSD